MFIKFRKGGAIHPLNAIFLKQKNAIRILNYAKYNARTEQLFKSCGILPLNSLIEFCRIQFLHNFIIGELPTSFFNYWMRNEDRRPAGAILRKTKNFTFPTQDSPPLTDSHANPSLAFGTPAKMKVSNL